MISILLAAASCSAPTMISLGTDSCLSFGALMRERYEYLRHPDWGAKPTDSNGYLLHRLLAYADLRLSDDLRGFVELGAAGVYGARNRERPTDRDWFDLHQAYVELSFEVLPLALRGGRQEVGYGSARLIAVRDETNVRRRFDGIRATLRTDVVQMDAMFLSPVETDPGVFDDGPERGQWLWGAYGTVLLAAPLNFDLYYLGLRRPHAEFAQGTALELRHTIGARIFGAWSGIDYDLELIYQLGSFGGARIQAWSVASEAGFTIEQMFMRPRIGLRANITSGDRDSNAPSLETFNPLYPEGTYFSEASLIGPLNHIDILPTLDVRLLDELVATLEWGPFWRESRSDAVYRVSTAPVVTGDRSRARYVGSQAAVKLEWEIDPNLRFGATYVHFFAGTFLSESGFGQDIDFIASWLAWRI